MMACGTLVFAPGESEKQVVVHIVNDAYAEPDQTFTITLSNPSGARLDDLHAASVTIRGDSPHAAQANPADDVRFFVRQHYLDFLSREPDDSGAQFWAQGITSCGADAGCREVKRIDTSAAFFLSIEFQRTGFLVYRMYEAAFGDIPGSLVPVRRDELLPDTQAVGRGVVVGAPGWEQQLEANKGSFAQAFVSRQRFADAYPAALTPAEFVARLNRNAGGALTQAEADALAQELAANGNTQQARAAALRKVAENAGFARREFDRAFVLMEYFGYLRRDPDDAGYRFWLAKLEQFGGDYVRAEMVKAFIQSTEYRQRFGPP